MKTPPQTTAALVIIDHMSLPDDMVKELSLYWARFNRRNYYIWHPQWYYWNKVVKHIISWDGDFKTN